MIRTLSLFLAAGALALLGASTLHAHDCGTDTAAKAATSGETIVDIAIEAGSFDTLVTAVKAAGLVETLSGEGPFTVFAPTDEAFAAIPEADLKALLADKAKLREVLTYHVVAGRVPAAQAVKLDWAPTVAGPAARIDVRDGQVFIDDARVVSTDIEASNGVIHVIDTVIMPRPNLAQTAIAAGSFDTLVKAVKAADLVDTLANKGPFTVFAPTDAAFGAIPAETLNALLADKPALQAVLTYHVLPGRVLAEDIPVGETMVTTVNGQDVSIVKNRDGSVTIDGARVVSTDVLAGNGVIHVIDAVILPQQQ